MIVIEGPDGAGKTTLINRLREDLGVEVAPRVVSKDAEAMTNLVQWVHANLRMGWQSLIFDRHRLISEPIYGPIVRGELELGFNDPEWFGAALRRFYDTCPEVIYCLPPLEVVMENVLSTDDNRLFHDNPQGVQQIWAAYLNKALTDYALYDRFCVVYDYTHPRAEAQYSSLKHHLDSRLARGGRA